jgi:hypothetical protein
MIVIGPLLTPHRQELSGVVSQHSTCGNEMLELKERNRTAMGEASLTGQNLVHSRLNQLAVFLHEVRLASRISRTAKSRLQPLLRQLLGRTENHGF